MFLSVTMPRLRPAYDPISWRLVGAEEYRYGIGRSILVPYLVILNSLGSANVCKSLRLFVCAVTCFENSGSTVQCMRLHVLYNRLKLLRYVCKLRHIEDAVHSRVLKIQVVVSIRKPSVCLFPSF